MIQTKSFFSLRRYGNSSYDGSSSHNSIHRYCNERLCSKHDYTTRSTEQQNQTASPEQIKNFLTQAIQALDSGNNTKAAEQIGLAEDRA